MKIKKSKCYKALVALIVGVSFSFNCTSQVEQFDESENNPWIIGASISVIDDSNTLFEGFFDFDDYYHFSNPFRIHVEKRFKEDYGMEWSLNLNSLEAGKQYNSRILEKPVNFISTDFFLKYYVTNLFLDKHRSFIEGYGIGGFGRSFFGWDGAWVVSGGAGLNIYISRNVRIFGQAIGKVPISNLKDRSNYIQYDLGIIYRLPKMK